MKVTKYNLKISDNLPKLAEEKSQVYLRDNISSPKDVVDLMSVAYRLEEMAEEYLYIVGVNMKGIVVGVFEISHGTVDTTISSPREIYIRMLLCGACRMFMVHNHPSGDPTPSQNDINMTERIRLSSQLLGIPVLDNDYNFYIGDYSLVPNVNEDNNLNKENIEKWSKIGWVDLRKDNIQFLINSIIEVYDDALERAKMCDNDIYFNFKKINDNYDIAEYLAYYNNLKNKGRIK